MSATISNPSDSELPAKWLIVPNESDPKYVSSVCPSPDKTFLSFIITNAVVTVVGVILGCRPVTHFLTCHLFADKGKKNTIKLNWMFPLASQFLANVVCGAIIHYTPGYSHVSVADVMMLYLARPRISMITLSTAAALFVFNREYPWMYALISTSIAELIIQIIAGIWIVVTGYRSWDLTFIVISAFILIGAGLTAIATILIVFMTRAYDATGGDVFNRTHYGGMRLSNSFLNRFLNWSILMLFACPAYIANWCFFGILVGGVKEGEVRWCPPKLSAQVAVWIIFPLLGILGGATAL